MAECFDECCLDADLVRRTFKHAPVLSYPFPVRYIPKVTDFGQADRLPLVGLRIVCFKKKDVEACEFVECALKAGDRIPLDLRDYAIGQFLKKVGWRRQPVPAVFVGAETVAVADYPSFPAMESYAAPPAAPHHFSIVPTVKRWFQRKPYVILAQGGLAA
jgi:hypothetical protein